MQDRTTELDRVEALYRLHASAVYWVAYGLLHDRDEAMDITQTVFVRAIRHAGKLDTLLPHQQKAWLIHAAKNASIDVLRAQRREMLIVEPLDEERAYDYSALPDVEFIRSEQRKAIAALVDTLPEAYWQPILLFYFAELEQREIAEMLSLNESTLRSRLYRAKAMLLSAIEKEGIL